MGTGNILNNASPFLLNLSNPERLSFLAAGFGRLSFFVSEGDWANIWSTQKNKKHMTNNFFNPVGCLFEKESGYEYNPFY